MDVKPPVDVPDGDKGFADPVWSENPATFAVRQGYLAARAGDLVGDAKARFGTGFLLDALAPESSTRPARRPGPRRPTTQPLIPRPGALRPPGTAARGGRTGRRGPPPAQATAKGRLSWAAGGTRPSEMPRARPCPTDLDPPS
jgi:hypothetical protein